MTVGLSFDHHVQRAVALALRRRGVDVITAAEDRAARRPDADLLARATELGRVFVSNDRDLIVITARWRGEGRSFAGLAFLTEQQIPYGMLIGDLALIAGALSPQDALNQIYYLPF